jgi:hypothetical protein
MTKGLLLVMFCSGFFRDLSFMLLHFKDTMRCGARS